MNQIEYVGKHAITYAVSRHTHASWELIYCISGAGTLYFDGSALPYGAGTVAIIPPRVPHENRSEQGFTNIFINIADPLLFNIRAPELVPDDGNHFLRNAFHAAFFHFSDETGQRQALLSAYGNLIICYLEAYRDSPPRSEVVEEIERSLIHNYPDCNFELDSYLRSLPFNYDYLRKLFKKETGITPHQYLQDLRLQIAAENLCLSDGSGLTVAEIARECGFREPLYFSRIFKKKYGVSPSCYRGTPIRSAGDSESMKIRPDGA